MDKALIRTCRIRVRPIRGHRRFGCHARMANTVTAGHRRHMKPFRYSPRQTNLFIDFYAVTLAHHANIRMLGGQYCAQFRRLFRRYINHSVGIIGGNADISPQRVCKIALQCGIIFAPAFGLDGQFRTTFLFLPINCNACAVRTTIRHGDQHFTEHLPKLWF